MNPTAQIPVASTDRSTHYASYSTEYLTKLSDELKYRIRVIDGTAEPRFTKNGRKIKQTPMPQFRLSWQLTVDAIATILAARNSVTY